MPAYAAAHLVNVNFGPDVKQYLERIDATLAPFDGHFAVHGANPEVLEGEWPGHLILIEFPDLAQARAWYQSDAYQQILPLRTGNSEGAVILVDGVDRDHLATDILVG